MAEINVAWTTNPRNRTMQMRITGSLRLEEETMSRVVIQGSSEVSLEGP